MILKCKNTVIIKRLHNWVTKSEEKKLPTKDFSDIVIYNNKYIPNLCPWPWHRAPNTLGISSMKRAIKVSFVIHNNPLFGTPETMLMNLLLERP